LSAATRAATGGRVRDELLTRLEALGTNARKGLITVLAKSGADIGFSLPLLAKLACGFSARHGPMRLRKVASHSEQIQRPVGGYGLAYCSV
jgi:hypothetical protein